MSGTKVANATGLEWKTRRALAAGTRSRGLRRLRQLMEERKKGAWRLLGIIILLGGVALLVATVSTAAGLYVRFRGAELLATLMISGALLGLMVALFLSALGHAVQAFFAAKDLWFWDASPAPPFAFFVDRTLETMGATLPAVVSLGAIALGGFVLGADLGLPTLLRTELALAAVVMVPVMAGIVVAHIGGAVLPAGKLRRVSLLVLTLASAGFLLWIRSIRIEKVVTEKGAEELLQSAQGLTHVGPGFLPSSFGAHFAVDGRLADGMGLFGTVSIAVTLAYIAHRLLYRVARDKASDDAPKGLSPNSKRLRMLRGFANLIAAPRTRALVERDLMVFVRDPAQWSQLILLVGIGMVYLINAQAMVEVFGGFGQASDVVLGAMHTGLVCFIAAGLGARFAFPSVAAEGPEFWLVEGAPLSEADYLAAKWRAALPVAAGYPIAVGMAGAFALGLSATTWVLSVLLVVVTSVSLAAFAVGRGARAPNFEAANLSELAMGPGALSTMAWSVSISAFVSIMFASITGSILALQTFNGSERNGVTSSALYVVVAVVVVAVLAIVATIGVRGLKTGASALHLRRHEALDR